VVIGGLSTGRRVGGQIPRVPGRLLVPIAVISADWPSLTGAWRGVGGVS